MESQLLEVERREVLVPAGGVELAADIAIPPGAAGLVIFAHGTGSGRHSPRNRYVAAALNRGAIGTILIDLLSEDEEAVDVQTADLRFNIGLLSRRLIAITEWAAIQGDLKRYELGYFGASTGAAAALTAAAERPGAVRALVSRGGRPDLAGNDLRRVVTPSLFIVGGDDTLVLRLNREAMTQLPQSTESRLIVVPGATHLFEEPGALDAVAREARAWFQTH